MLGNPNLMDGTEVPSVRAGRFTHGVRPSNASLIFSYESVPAKQRSWLRSTMSQDSSVSGVRRLASPNPLKQRSSRVSWNGSWVANLPYRNSKWHRLSGDWACLAGSMPLLY